MEGGNVKKLKREAAQRRKAQARSLKLRSEEQERLQRQEIDALVEQQRLQRLRKEGAERLSEQAHNLSLNDDIASPPPTFKCCSKQQQPVIQSGVQQQQQQCEDSENNFKDSSSWPVPEKSPKQVPVTSTSSRVKQQEQQMKGVESKRRLGRGRSSETPNTGATNVSSAGQVLPQEDHRVVSTEYQAAGTQALMRVTLLAAGFVIGARGISARLIGQVTGAIIQSWTESTSTSACRPSTGSVPIRLFRIQGKKPVVQAAVSLVEQAVAKYRELCECKKRGEFVQREHVINGVEFYYQPPPRKTFAAAAAAVPTPELLGSSKTSPPSTASPTLAGGTTSGERLLSVSDVPLASSLAFPPHQVWLHHLHQKQMQKQQRQSEVLQDGSTSASGKQEEACETLAPVQACHSEDHQNTSLEQQKGGDGVVTSARSTSSQGDPTSSSTGWTSEQHLCQEESSLFSVFGNGGLPLPIAQDCRPPAPFMVKSSVSSTPFDFPKYDFLRAILPAFPVPPFQQLHHREDYNLFAHHQPPVVHQCSEDLCIVCLERPSATRLVPCGHASFCLFCVQELGNCPVCREKIVGWQPSRAATAPAGTTTGTTTNNLWSLGPCSTPTL